jgi:hypothetical protein
MFTCQLLSDPFSTTFGHVSKLRKPLSGTFGRVNRLEKSPTFDHSRTRQQTLKALSATSTDSESLRRSATFEQVGGFKGLFQPLSDTSP